MKRIAGLTVVLVLVAALVSAAPITANVNEKSLDVVLQLDDLSDYDALKPLYLTVIGRDGNDLRLQASEDEVAYLEAQGFEVKVVGRFDGVKAAGYRSYPEVVAELQDIAQTYGNLAKRFEIGTSAGGKTMYALKISDNVNLDEIEPALLYDHSIHGDEAIATELAFAFIYELLDNYGSTPAITNLVDSNEIWIVPAVNPDGLTLRRGNGNGVDMNRNYPFGWEGFGSWNGQPETFAMMDFVMDIRPLFSISYHSGAEVVNYCWDGIYTRSPEDDLERAMSHVYDNLANYGITNGADWYIADGTSEDWYHGAIGTISVIVEISYNKMPPAANIPAYLNKNVPAMVAWAQKSADAVHGLVTNAATGEPLEAVIVADSRLPVTSDPISGDFYRLLPAGNHTLYVWANGFGWNEVPVTVPSSGGVDLDVELTPAKATDFGALRTVLNFRKDNNDRPDNVSLPTAVLGGADDVAFSLGVNGYAAFEFGETTAAVDGSGADFRVVEKGDDEGYTVLVAAQWTGPWQSLGAGSGTTEFDLASSGLAEARYVLIQDDGDGANTGATPGADIDAIEAFAVCDTPVVNFSGTPLTGAAPLDVAFTATVDVAPGCLDTLSWDFGDGGSSDELSPTHVYNAPGVYTVTLTASGPGGDDELTREDYISVTGGDDVTDDDTGGDDDTIGDDDAAGDDDDDDDDDDSGGGCG
ncbi:MAG: M14 family zinc carboxypeptidase [Candidatus Lernaella stagnicola]|nr:M14 family zinc carboxypeptidase [Candidatus Lernaella stagnicola]